MEQDNKPALIRLEDKLDQVSARINSIDVTLAKQSVILEEHIQRTLQLENRVSPLEQHALRIGGMFKLLGAMVTAGGLLIAILDVILRAK